MKEILNSFSLFQEPKILGLSALIEVTDNTTTSWMTLLGNCIFPHPFLSKIWINGVTSDF